jgi:hypothetical protein
MLENKFSKMKVKSVIDLNERPEFEGMDQKGIADAHLSRLSHLVKGSRMKHCDGLKRENKARSNTTRYNFNGAVKKDPPLVCDTYWSEDYLFSNPFSLHSSRQKWSKKSRHLEKL